MTTDDLARELDAHFPKTPEQQAEWRLEVFPGWERQFPSMADVCAWLRQPDALIQRNSRGLVLLMRRGEDRFIAKRALRQERRRWTQLTSLYRRGEGCRTLRNMARLHQAGLPVPEPVFILEKFRFGMTVASCGVYRYVEGATCAREQAAQIAATLKQMHAAGWVHRDPHVWNFLIHQGKISILDCAQARPSRSRYAQMYDVALLNKCCPGSFAFYGVAESDQVYRLAQAQNRLLVVWRSVKRRMRG